jgi:3-deoxy-D-manno-octulosonate 8-phosphate phosphatase (KDO 8-P phosphatase)
LEKVTERSRSAKKAGEIRLLFLDIDGVMTDGRITMNHHGEEFKSFDAKDGLGLKMLMSGGIDVIVVSGRRSKVVQRRAEEVGICEVYQGVSDKRALLRQVIREKGLQKEAIGCIGDDLPDLAMFEEAGLRIAVADAVREVRQAADYVTKNRGGFGAVREACEWLLKCQGKWKGLVEAVTAK